MSIPSVAVITSIYDNYEILKSVLPQFGVETEWICVTDGLSPQNVENSEGWQIITEPRPNLHPNRAAKIAKCAPWNYTTAPCSIWIDGSYRVTSPLFAVEALRFAKPIGQFVHPWRSCIYTEADHSRTLLKYREEEILKQIREYHVIGHPDDWGLWATGVIARKHTEDVKIMGLQWLSEIDRWTFQDQLSEPVVLRMCDLRPAPLPGNHISNPWLRYEGSARH